MDSLKVSTEASPKAGTREVGGAQSSQELWCGFHLGRVWEEMQMLGHRNQVTKALASVVAESWRLHSEVGLERRLPERHCSEESWAPSHAVSSLDGLIVGCDVYQLYWDQAIVKFFFPIVKLVPASQTGNLLPELFSNMNFTGKTRCECFRDFLGDCLHWLHF